MMNRVFFDSNLLIYVYSQDEPRKKKVAIELVTSNHQIIISTQVYFEFINVMHRKFKLDTETIGNIIAEFKNYCDVATIQLETIGDALKILKRYRYSFADSLIIATAIQQQCDILYSEDMHDQHQIENLVIINPFKKT